MSQDRLSEEHWSLLDESTQALTRTETIEAFQARQATLGGTGHWYRCFNCDRDFLLMDLEQKIKYVTFVLHQQTL